MPAREQQPRRLRPHQAYPARHNRTRRATSSEPLSVTPLIECCCWPRAHHVPPSWNRQRNELGFSLPSFSPGGPKPRLGPAHPSPREHRTPSSAGSPLPERAATFPAGTSGIPAAPPALAAKGARQGLARAPQHHRCQPRSLLSQR